MKQQVNYKQKGQQLFRQGKYSEAVIEATNSLNALSEKFKNNEIKDEKEGRHLIKTIKLPCLKIISQCQFKLNKIVECQDACNKILKIDGDCANTIFMKGQIRFKQDNLQDALTLLHRACFLQPDNKIFQKALKDTQSLYKQKHNLSFSDRQVARIAWSLGWIVSLFAYLIGLIPYLFRVFKLIINFFTRNTQNLFKSTIKFIFKKSKNILWYFYAGIRNANKYFDKYNKRLPYFQQNKEDKQKQNAEPETPTYNKH